MDIFRRALTRVSCRQKLPTVCLKTAAAPGTVISGVVTKPPLIQNICPILKQKDGSWFLQIPRYTRIYNRLRVDVKKGLVEKKSAPSELNCVVRCNQLGDRCKGFYIDPTKNCYIYSTAISYDTDIKPAAGYHTYQRLCVPAHLAQSTDIVYDVVPQKALQNSKVTTVAASSLANCMLQCLNSLAAKKFACTSGMFYPTERVNVNGATCILNSQTAEAQPSNFVTETKTVPAALAKAYSTYVYYFDVGRGPGINPRTHHLVLANPRAPYFLLTPACACNNTFLASNALTSSRCLFFKCLSA